MRICGFAVLIAIALSACGGGGGSNSSAAGSTAVSTATTTSTQEATQISGLSLIDTDTQYITKGTQRDFFVTFRTNADPADVVISLDTSDTLFSLRKDQSSSRYIVTANSLANTSLGEHKLILKATTTSGAVATSSQTFVVKNPDTQQAIAILPGQNTLIYTNGLRLEVTSSHSLAGVSVTVSTSNQPDGSIRYGLKASREPLIKSKFFGFE